MNPQVNNYERDLRKVMSTLYYNYRGYHSEIVDKPHVRYRDRVLTVSEFQKEVDDLRSAGAMAIQKSLNRLK